MDLEDIEKNTGVVLKRCTKAGRPFDSIKHRFGAGQVLYSKLRPYLNKVVLADSDGYCTSEIIPLTFASSVIPEYARYLLMSPYFLAYADQCSYGVKMPRLSSTDAKRAFFPLPPVNEQQRIVNVVKKTFARIEEISASLN